MITTGERIAAVILIFLAIATGITGLAVAINGDSTAASNSVALQQLLLDGKTASAISAKKTAGEVEALLTDHARTSQQQQALAALVVGVEKHLDATIKRAVNAAALKVAREFGH